MIWDCISHCYPWYTITNEHSWSSRILTFKWYHAIKENKHTVKTCLYIYNRKTQRTYESPKFKVMLYDLQRQNCTKILEGLISQAERDTDIKTKRMWWKEKWNCTKCNPNIIKCNPKLKINMHESILIYANGWINS